MEKRISIGKFGFTLPSGVVNSLTTSFIGAFMVAISSILLARILDPNMRGEYAIIVLWPTMLSTLGCFGLDFAFSYFVAQPDYSIRVLWTWTLLFSCVIGGFLYIFAVLIVPFALPTLSIYLLAILKLSLIATPFIISNRYQSSLLLGSGHIVESNYLRIFFPVFYSFGIFALALFKLASIPYLTLLFIFSYVLNFGLATLLVFIHMHPSFTFQTKGLPTLLLYGGKAYLNSIMAQANLRLDQFMMSLFLAPIQLGYYVVAVTISGALTPVFTAMAVVVLPKILQAGETLIKGQLAARYFKLGLVLGLPISLAGVFLSSWGIRIFFGNNYVPAVLATQILLIAGIFSGENMVLGQSLRGLGYPGWAGIAEGIGLIVTVTLLFLLLPRIGFIGAAITSLCAYALVTIIELIIISRFSSMKLNRFCSIRNF